MISKSYDPANFSKTRTQKMHLLQEHGSKRGKVIQHDRNIHISYNHVFYGLPIMTIMIPGANRHYG